MFEQSNITWLFNHHKLPPISGLTTKWCKFFSYTIQCLLSGFLILTCLGPRAMRLEAKIPLLPPRCQGTQDTWLVQQMEQGQQLLQQ